MSQNNTALVIGAGAFGTSIASVLANNFKKVYIKVRSQDVYDSINKKRENNIYLPGMMLPDNIIALLDWNEVDKSVFDNNLELIASGIPSHALKNYFQNEKERFEKFLKSGVPFVSLSKGIDPETLELVDDMLFDIFPTYKENFVFLSGPSFANEIMEEQITLVTLAGKSLEVLTKVSKSLETSYFKGWITYDIKGVLLGGALKNVLAIAGGIVEGLGFNDNTRAAMITRGIAEMNRFGRVLNARPETFYGLSGMGDLILTTTGALSRNKQFGLEMAKGRKAEDILKIQRTVVEGYKTTLAAHLLSKKFSIRANIFNGVYKVLYEGVPPQKVIFDLMKIPSMFELV